MSMAVDLRTFHYRTDFTATQPPMLGTWDSTPFALATPTPGRRVIEILRRVSGHLSRLESPVSGLEVVESLADATPVGGEPEWAAPLRIVQRFDRGDAGAPPLSSSRRQRAIEAIDQLRGLCDLSDERAADLMGVARGTLRSWRSASREPYPATTRHLLEVDSVVSALVRSLGPTAARDWLWQPAADGTSARLDVLAEEEGPRRLLALVRQSLFPGRGPSLLPSPESLEALNGTFAEPEAYEPAAFSGGPVRRRRAP
jgi:hypothetical protein